MFARTDEIKPQKGHMSACSHVHVILFPNYTWTRNHCENNSLRTSFPRNSGRICGARLSGPEEGVITKGVFSLEESLESLKSLIL